MTGAQRRGARGAQLPGRRITMGTPNHYRGAESLWGRRMTAGGTEKS